VLIDRTPGPPIPFPERRSWALELPATVRLAVAAATGLAAFWIVALHRHAPYDIEPGPIAQGLATTAPFVTALVASLAVLRPRLGYVVVLLLLPFWAVAQVAWWIGDVQVINQTVLLVALTLGLLLQRDDGASATPGAEGTGRRRAVLERTAAGAVMLLLILAFLSTAASADVAASATVLVHGVVEPIAMGLLLIALRPTRRLLVLTLLALGLAVALGGLVNLVQTLPSDPSLAGLQANRLLFARLTFFNVGLFGEMLAMALPILVGLLIARRRLHLDGRPITAVLIVAVILCVASLYLTFSKSGWIAAAVGLATLSILVVEGWRKRAAVVLAATVLSTFIVPWPAIVLRATPGLDEAYRAVMVGLVGDSRFDSWNPSTRSGRGSLLERLWATRAAAQMAVDHPWLGIGLDQFRTLYVPGRYQPPEATLDLISAHTFWPEIAAELGIPALVLVAFLLSAALRSLWRVYRAPPDRATRVLAAALLATMLAWLVVATTFDVDLYREWRKMASDIVMIAVLIAASFALHGLALEPARRRRSSPSGETDEL